MTLPVAIVSVPIVSVSPQDYPSLALPPSPTARRPGPITETEAIDIWIARWLRVRRRDLLARYGCDPRRIYEVWAGERHPASRTKAMTLFAARFPTLVDRIDYGRHRRIERRPPPDLQPSLFD